MRNWAQTRSCLCLQDTKSVDLPRPLTRLPFLNLFSLTNPLLSISISNYLIKINYITLHNPNKNNLLTLQYNIKGGYKKIWEGKILDSSTCWNDTRIGYTDLVTGLAYPRELAAAHYASHFRRNAVNGVQHHHQTGSAALQSTPPLRVIHPRELTATSCRHSVPLTRIN